MRTSIVRTAAMAAFSTFIASQALAHATVSPREIAPGYAKIVISIGHGCDGAATKSVRVEIPDGFVAAKPMPKPDWTIDIETGDYAKSYKMHGQEVKSGAVAITWKGELPDAYFDEFALNGMVSGVEPGSRLFFKTEQTCDKGSLSWSEEAKEGENPHSLEHPAPFVTIADGGGHEMHDHGHAMDGMKMDMGGASHGPITIEGAHARAMLPGQPTGAGYLTIENDGTAPDRLVSVSSPAAGKVEVHEMKMEGTVMRMNAVEGGMEIPAGGRVELKPNGYHLMFSEVKKPFAKGDRVPVTLHFDKGGDVETTLPVGPASGGMDHMKHGKM